MTAVAKQPRERPFLFPTARVYPFDETCEAIVRALVERNYKVPGVEVDLKDYALGRYVSVVEGEDFRLWFCRGQARRGEWNDVAAVARITTPKESLGVYSDMSGPTYNVLVAPECFDLKSWLASGGDVNSRLRGRPRSYLHYSGRGDTAGRHYVTPAPYVVHDDDLGREYSPSQLQEGEMPSVAWQHAAKNAGNDPTHDAPRVLCSRTLYENFDRWLRENVLPRFLTEAP